MTRMDSSLARGYARALIHSKPDQSSLDNWIKSPHAMMAMKSYSRYCAARPAKRMAQVRKIAKFMQPRFTLSRNWEGASGHAYFEGVGLAQAQESSVLDVSAPECKRFKETALFLNTVLLGPSPYRSTHTAVATYITSNMSHHAVQRLLERGLCTPEDLDATCLDILKRGRFLGMASDDPQLMDFDSSVMMPIPGGAAICAFSTVKPNSTRTEPLDILSIRTVLSDDLIRPAQRAGFQEFERLHDAGTNDVDTIIQWARDHTLPARRAAIPA